MEWAKRSWLAILIVLAIMGSFAASRAESIKRDVSTQQNQIAECRRSAARAAVNAAVLMEASQTRSVGRPEQIQKYEAFAASQAALIPAPLGLEGNRALWEGKFVLHNGRMSFRLSKEALRLHADGCERVFPAP